jgi:hypothetical protein
MSTTTIAAVPAGRPGIARRVCATTSKLSDRVHAAADDRAQALGWEVTKTPGWLGLAGRSYRDPQFGARQPARHDPQTGRHGRHD